MVVGIPGVMLCFYIDDLFWKEFFSKVFVYGMLFGFFLYLISEPENKFILWSGGLLGTVFLWVILSNFGRRPIFPVLIIVTVITISFKIWSKKRKNKENETKKILISVEANEFLERIKEREGMIPVESNIIPKKGEQVFWEEKSSLYEIRSVRQYQSGSTGVRVFKGFYVGGSKGRSVSSYELTKLDDGVLSITNKRIIFNGQTIDRTITLDKVFSINRSLTEVEISVENRQKSMIFDVSNPFIFSMVFMICNQVEDPTDLSQINLNITFEE